MGWGKEEAKVGWWMEAQRVRRALPSKPQPSIGRSSRQLLAMCACSASGPSPLVSATMISGSEGVACTVGEYGGKNVLQGIRQAPFPPPLFLSRLCLLWNDAKHGPKMARRRQAGKYPRQCPKHRRRLQATPAQAGEPNKRCAPVHSCPGPGARADRAEAPPSASCGQGRARFGERAGASGGGTCPRRHAPEGVVGVEEAGQQGGELRHAPARRMRPRRQEQLLR
jgi:hypothetical protein